MTAQEKLNRSARAHGWANWSEVLMHNAPAHVINLIVEDAMRGEPVGKPEPALTWRPGARVRITGRSNEHEFHVGQEVYVMDGLGDGVWVCSKSEHSGFGYAVHESDAVVVG